MAGEKIEADEEVDANIKYAFIVIKSDAGMVVQVSKNYPQPDGVDEIYEAVCLVKRNLEVQQYATALQQVLSQVAMEAQGQRDSGLVVPQGVKS